MKHMKLNKLFLALVITVTPILTILAVGVANAETAIDNYNLYCVQCHGTKGTGKGINAPALAVAPRNHTSAKDMKELTDANVFQAIKDGGVAVGKSTQMPSFAGNLTDAEINDLVKHLRGMCKCVGNK